MNRTEIKAKIDLFCRVAKQQNRKHTRDVQNQIIDEFAKSFRLLKWIENKFITELEPNTPSNILDKHQYVVQELLEMKRLMNVFHQFFMDVQNICLESEKYELFLKSALANRYMRIKQKVLGVRKQL
jgi:hypothetical protein